MPTESAVLVRVPVQDAIGIAGAVKVVAAFCRVSVRAVYLWLSGERKLPTARVPAVIAALENHADHDWLLFRRFANVLEALAVLREKGATPGRLAILRRRTNEAIVEVELAARKAERAVRK
jgi:hypothetical protein